MSLLLLLGKPAGSFVNCTLVVTEASDTVSASGSIGFSPVTATLSVTENADTVSGSAPVALSAAFAQTESDDSLVSSGAITGDVTASLDVIEASDTVDASAYAEPVASDNGWLGGGADLRFMDRQQSADQKREERERLGIIPAEIKRAVEVAARIEAREPVKAISNEQAALDLLARDLEREQIAWRDFYADLLREERRRLIDEELAWRMRALIDEQDEEQAVLLMLAEM